MPLDSPATSLGALHAHTGNYCTCMRAMLSICCFNCLVDDFCGSRRKNIRMTKCS